MTTIVIDTAPTGHALRLLQTPAVLRDWTQALMRILLKYRESSARARSAALLVLSKRLAACSASSPIAAPAAVRRRDPRRRRCRAETRAVDRARSSRLGIAAGARRQRRRTRHLPALPCRRGAEQASERSAAGCGRESMRYHRGPCRWSAAARGRDALSDVERASLSGCDIISAALMADTATISTASCERRSGRDRRACPADCRAARRPVHRRGLAVDDRRGRAAGRLRPARVEPRAARSRLGRRTSPWRTRPSSSTSRAARRHGHSDEAVHDVLVAREGGRATVVKPDDPERAAPRIRGREEWGIRARGPAAPERRRPRRQAQRRRRAAFLRAKKQARDARVMPCGNGRRGRRSGVRSCWRRRSRGARA